MSIERTDWLLIALLWLAGLGAAAQFGKIAVLFEDLRVLYSASAVLVGLLVSVVGFVGVVFGATAGMIVARFGDRRVILVALGVGAMVSLVEAFLPPLWLLFPLRIVEGFSHLALVVAAPVLIAQVSRPEHQPFAMTLWSTFFGVSFALVAWLGPVAAARFGLGVLFLGHGLWCALIAVALMFTLPRTQPDIVTTGLFTGVIQRHIDMYRSPWISASGLGFVFYTMTYVAILTLLPGLMAAEWRVWIATAMPLISIAASLTIGVWILRHVSAVSAVVTGFAGAIFSAVLVGLGGGAGIVSLIGALILACFLGLVQGASFASIPALAASAQDRARSAGVLAQMGNVGTSVGTPLLAYVIAQNGLAGLSGFVIVLSAGGILMHLWLAQRRRRGGQG